MVAPVADFLRNGIKVGLGIYSGGRFALGMLDSIRQAIIASNAREVLSQGVDKGLTLSQVFYLATRGGVEVLDLDHKIGNFAVGKDFDAAWTSSEPLSSMTMREEDDSLKTLFEKFLMTGDDRNITQVFVQGRRVKQVII